MRDIEGSLVSKGQDGRHIMEAIVVYNEPFLELERGCRILLAQWKVRGSEADLNPKQLRITKYTLFYASMLRYSAKKMKTVDLTSDNKHKLESGRFYAYSLYLEPSSKPDRQMMWLLYLEGETWAASRLDCLAICLLTCKRRGQTNRRGSRTAGWRSREGYMSDHQSPTSRR